jgi:hypothetical protein
VTATDRSVRVREVVSRWIRRGFAPQAPAR